MRVKPVAAKRMTATNSARIARTARGACDPEHQQSEDEDAQSSGDREAVEHERSPEHGAPRTRPGQRARAEHRESTNSQGLCEALRIGQAPSDRKVQAEHRKGPGDQEGLGPQREKEFGVVGVHGAPPLKTAWNTGD